MGNKDFERDKKNGRDLKNSGNDNPKVKKSAIKNNDNNISKQSAQGVKQKAANNPVDRSIPQRPNQNINTDRRPVDRTPVNRSGGGGGRVGGRRP